MITDTYFIMKHQKHFFNAVQCTFKQYVHVESFRGRDVSDVIDRRNLLDSSIHTNGGKPREMSEFANGISGCTLDNRYSAR